MRQLLLQYLNKTLTFPSTGSPSVDYSKLTWSGLPGPDQSCVLEKVTISAGQFVNAGVSCVLGVKDKPVHISHDDDYFGMLQNISDRHFVFYDPDNRQAWLLDGASALLHLLRASIQHHQDDQRLRRLLCSPDNLELEESSYLPTLGSRAASAWEVLSNQDNLSIPLGVKNMSTWVETTTRQGEKADHATKEKTNYLTVGNRAEQLCHILSQIAAHHDDVHTQSGVGFRLRATPRPQLEGFDFSDIATAQGTLWPKVAMLKAKGCGWVDFTRAIHAPTLFASGLGPLFTPAGSAGPTAPDSFSSLGTSIMKGNSSCSACHFNSPLPQQKDLLAATTSDLQAILRRWGNMRNRPWRVVENIHWYSPDLVCEPCTPETCGASEGKGRRFKFSGNKGKEEAAHDRVQVLIPATFPRRLLFFRKQLASPGKLPAHGAVVFGHSSKFPLRWGLNRGEPPEAGEPEPDEEEKEKEKEVEDMVGRFEDSGIGTSLGSLRSRTQSDSDSGGDEDGDGGGSGSGHGTLGFENDWAAIDNSSSSLNLAGPSGKGKGVASSAIYMMPNTRFVSGDGRLNLKRDWGEDDCGEGGAKRVRGG